MRQPIIAVDVDDTVAQLMPTWVRLYNKKYRRRLKREDIIDWHCSAIPQEHRGDWFGMLNNNELYDTVIPVDGALDGVKFLRNIGCRVVFVTSSILGHAGRKLTWLRDHGFLYTTGTQSEPDYIECFDKTLVRADIIVDDKPDTCVAWQGPALMLITPANAAWQPPQQNLIYKHENWRQIMRHVEQLINR